MELTHSYLTACCSDEVALGNGGSEFVWEKEHEARQQLWKARHELYYAILALEPGKKVGDPVALNMFVNLPCVYVVFILWLSRI